MTVHVLVEGPSEQAFLEPWAKRFLKEDVVRVHPHQGKGTLPGDLGATPEPTNRALLHQLPAKLRAFTATLDPRTDGVLVLVDADDDDCTALAERLVEAVKAIAGKLRVVIRVAVEETEAFYLGDLHALKSAFPDANLALARKYEPDSICGTWELFGKVVGDGGGNKVAWAEAMGPKLTTDPAKSKSPSFRALCRALRRLADPQPDNPKPPKKFRHTARTDISRRE